MNGLRQLLDDVADGVEPTPRGPLRADLAIEAAEARRRRRRAALLAGAAAAVVVAVVVSASFLLPGPTPRPAAGGGVPVLPSVLRTVDRWQAPPVRDEPVDRVSVVVTGMPWRQGFTGGTAWDTAVLVDADGSGYRTTPRGYGDGGPLRAGQVAVSTDGRRVALVHQPELGTGDDPADSRIDVLEVGSGNLRTYPLPGSGLGEETQSLAFSPDGARLLVLGGARTSWEWTEAPDGRSASGGASFETGVWVLDLRQGSRTDLDGRPVGAAWAPDGSILASVEDDRAPQDLVLRRYTAQGQARGDEIRVRPQDLAVPVTAAGQDPWLGALPLGPGAVAADGDSVVLPAPATGGTPGPFVLVHVPLDGRSRPDVVRLPGELDDVTVLGWRDGDPVVSQTGDEPAVVSVDLEGGGTTTLTTVEQPSAVNGLQVVAAAADVVAVGVSGDTAPRPARWWHPRSVVEDPASTVVPIALLLLVGFVAWRRLRRLRRPRAAPATPDTPSGQEA